MSSPRNHRHEQAKSMVKLQGIIGIVFGSLGVFFGLIVLAAFAVSLNNAYTNNDAVGFMLLFIATLLFWLLPHIYLIISGSVLLRLPEPRIVKILTIINIVIGVFWNYIILIFAIISLTQSLDYDEGHHLYRHEK